MACPLRRIWCSVRSLSLLASSSSTSSSRRIDSDDCAVNDLVNPAEYLSGDVLLLIFSYLTARDLAAVLLVCKHWFSMASSESLWHRHLMRTNPIEIWHLVTFSEKYLDGGPCLIRSISRKVSISHQLYARRIWQPCSVIIDGGSGYCKYGWGNSYKPCGRFPTFMAFGNIETPMYSPLRDFFATIFDHLSAKPSLQPVVVSTPICHNDDTKVAFFARRSFRSVIYKVLFDMGVRAVCSIDQAVLALYASAKTSGIVVNIGFQVTSVVPVLHGKIMRSAGVEVVGQGALNFTACLCELMQQSGIPFDNITIVKALKEKLCYVAQDYGKELLKDTEAVCHLQNVGEFRLSHERFKATEILFQPHLGGLRTMSLHQAVALCMAHCAQATSEEDMWYRNVILCGGSACFPGLAERLEKELHGVLPRSLRENVTVFPPQHGPDSAWFGAKLISNLSSFQEAWCITKKEFQRQGQSILDKQALDEL